MMMGVGLASSLLYTQETEIKSSTYRFQGAEQKDMLHIFRQSGPLGVRLRVYHLKEKTHIHKYHQSQHL